MVRITTEAQNDYVVLRVEGSLRGPWVSELERVWRRTRDRHKHLCVKLADVSYVDDAAKVLLTRMFQNGTELSARGPFMTAIVQDIMQTEALPGPFDGKEIPPERPDSVPSAKS